MARWHAGATVLLPRMESPDMSYQRQVSRKLDDEHRVNLELLGRIEQAFARAPRSGNAGNAELTQLAQLHQQGILTDEEFSAKKAQILGI